MVAAHMSFGILLAAVIVLRVGWRLIPGHLMPPPFAPFSRPAHHLIGELHEWNGWAIVILATGHALAALYHHYVLHDRVLSRMLPAVRAR